MRAGVQCNFHEVRSFLFRLVHQMPVHLERERYGGMPRVRIRPSH